MKNLLNSAKHEINALRKQNEILRAKVEVMDLFAVVLHTKPAYPEQVSCVDVVWEIERELTKLEEEPAKSGRFSPELGCDDIINAMAGEAKTVTQIQRVCLIEGMAKSKFYQFWKLLKVSDRVYEEKPGYWKAREVL